MIDAAVPIIDPAGIYDDALLRDVLQVSAATLARARRDGRLRCTVKGKRVLYLGEWVIAWLRDDPERQGAADAS